MTETAPEQAAMALGTPGTGAAAAGEVVPPGEDPAAEAAQGPSLSPSRAADFMACPLLYRFRVIDRLPEVPSPVAARGTLVHAVLERLFDAPAASRTPQAAKDLLPAQWERLLAEEPELAGIFTGDAERQTWFEEAARMLDRYFTLEDPARLEPTHREASVQAVLDSGLTLRGYIDRLDVARTGELRIVDYKTGTAPSVDYEARALFQMKFYAVALWRARGVMPRMLQLIYLGNGELVRYAPDEADLVATERKINAIWRAIERAQLNSDWRPRPSRICDWCAHRALCPAHGGIPPPLPATGTEPAPEPAAERAGVLAPTSARASSATEPPVSAPARDVPPVTEGVKI